MKSTQGQKYVQNFFFKGLMADIDSEMITDPTGVLSAHCMHLSNKSRNVIKKLPGDKEFVELTLLGDQVFTGAVWLVGYVVEFWRDIIAGYTNIYANGLLVAQHADIPGDPTHMLDIDTCDETMEMFITDNKQCPIVLDLQDMLDSYSTTTYFADYDKSLYEINRAVDLSQPVFKQLEELGSGGGLKAGSYAYAMRFSTISGEKTSWGPVSPYIPVPYDTKALDLDHSLAYNGTMIVGQEPSLTATKFGIRLRLHINNDAKFDYVELKRYANYTGQPITYTPTAEYIILSLDADGAIIDIQKTPDVVIDFIDTDSLEWATLDESEINTYSTIKKARTIRYYDKRIVLGGVEYESKLISDKDIFINHASVSKLAFPFIESLGSEGYGNMINQVYKKSHRLGERYGFAAKLYDEQGNVLYAVPLKNDTQDFTNYRFPNRRSIIPTAERSFSPLAQNISTIFSYNPYVTISPNYVYEPIASALVLKDAATQRNIVSKEVDGTTYDYNPVTPTGVDSGYGNNGSDFTGLDEEFMASAEGLLYNTSRHGINKSAVGLTIGGIDTTKLPSFVKAFSIVRTPAAGRVVCQGIAMYALNSEGYGNSPVLTKALNKVWFYSPEIDENIGNKSYLFDDIKANPSNYQVQLVSPVGFFTDVYSGGEFSGYSNVTIKIDMISYAIMGGNDVQDMEPFGFDTASDIGHGYGRVTFGRFRNVSGLQGSGIVDYNLTFDLSAAEEPTLDSIGDSNNRSRTPYLELTLGSNIYAYTDVDSESGDTLKSRRFHEPWYVVNIIKEDAGIANNNINSYNDIGHYIKLESKIGISNGEADQLFELVEERIEDVYGLGEDAVDYRYIYVDGLPWLDANNLNAGRLTTYRGLLESVGHFTPLNGSVVCYGLYLANEDTTSTGSRKYISFPYTTTPSGDPICPAVGSEIVVKYDNNSPIELFLGDTYVHDAVFAPVDCNLENYNISSLPVGFGLNAPMPYFNFTMGVNYLQPRAPEAGSAFNTVFEAGGGGNPHQLEFIRQWLVSFGCESSVNLPFIYKNYFPNRNYVMRPAIYNLMEDTETVEDYLADVGIYSYYDTDYPDECLNWAYGGFHLASGANWDYEKRLHSKVFTEPASGANEILVRKKRIHWSTQGITGYPSSKSFIPTNIYDLTNDKASQISILYDVFSDKGNNLYVITDRGVGLLLTGKQMISDANGNALSILASDSSLIQGELWLNQGVGCPREFWRGKSEGNVKLPNNVKVPILVFPTYNDIVMLSANNIIELADNNREVLVTALKTVDLTRDFITNLYSVVDEGENNIWVVLGDTTYLFSIDNNNWCAHIIGLTYVKSLYAPYLEGVDDRNVLAHIIGGDNILPPTTTAAPTTTEEPVTTIEPTTVGPTTTGAPTTTGIPTTAGPTTTGAPTTTMAATNLSINVVYSPGAGYVNDPFIGAVSIHNTGGAGWARIYYRALRDYEGPMQLPIIGPANDLCYIPVGDSYHKFDGLTYPDEVGKDNVWQISLDHISWESCIGTFEIIPVP